MVFLQPRVWLPCHVKILIHQHPTVFLLRVVLIPFSAYTCARDFPDTGAGPCMLNLLSLSRLTSFPSSVSTGQHTSVSSHMLAWVNSIPGSMSPTKTLNKNSLNTDLQGMSLATDFNKNKACQKNNSQFRQRGGIIPI